jgi:hypothetical protein
MIIGGRQGGKSAAQRKAVLAAIEAGHEVHVAARDGLWRVTATGLGQPLWEKIRQPCPDRKQPPVPGLYERAQRGYIAAG